MKVLLARFAFSLAGAAKRALTKKCPAGSHPVGASWNLSTPYSVVSDSFPVGGRGWRVGARNLDPNNPVQVTGSLVCLRAKKLGLVFRPGPVVVVPGARDGGATAGEVSGGNCKKGEIPIGGGFVFGNERGLEVNRREIGKAFGQDVFNYSPTSMSTEAESAFAYSTNDSSSLGSNTTVGTVCIEITNVIWFVDQ